LTHNKHNNPYLQNAWNKYGRDNFHFVIIEEIINSENLSHIEQQYIDQCDRDKSYNISICSTAPMRGRFMSDDTKKKMSETQKKRIFTPEHRKNISESKLGTKHHFYGKRPPNYGKKTSDEVKLKQSISAVKRHARERLETGDVTGTRTHQSNYSFLFMKQDWYNIE
jgi:group I intron endonuclease